MVVVEEEEEEVGRARVSQAAAAPPPSHAGSGHTKSSPGVRMAGVIVTDALPFVGLKAQEKGEREVEEGSAMNPASVLITEAGVSPLTVTLALAAPPTAVAVGREVGCTT